MFAQLCSDGFARGRKRGGGGGAGEDRHEDANAARRVPEFSFKKLNNFYKCTNFFSVCSIRVHVHPVQGARPLQVNLLRKVPGTKQEKKQNPTSSFFYKKYFCFSIRDITTLWTPASRTSTGTSRCSPERTTSLTWQGTGKAFSLAIFSQTRV